MAIALEQLPIKWSVFTPAEQDLLKMAYKFGHREAFGAAIRIKNPEQEKEVQKLMNAATPLNIGFVSEVKKEMDILESQGVKLFKTPEDEAIWQKKLDDEYSAWQEEQRKTMAKYESEIIETQKEESSSVAADTQIVDPESLTSLKGLPEKSIEKLRLVGITSQPQLFAMTYPQAIKILGPLVATRFRDRFAK